MGPGGIGRTLGGLEGGLKRHLQGGSHFFVSHRVQTVLETFVHDTLFHHDPLLLTVAFIFGLVM